MDGATVTLEAHLHPMAPAWPLGADNTTDSLSDDAGSQISVVSIQKIAKSDLTHALILSGVPMKWIETTQRYSLVTSA